MPSQRIASLKNEYLELRDYFRTSNQISFELYIDNTYKKSLLLSAASCFESLITDIVIEYAKHRTGGDDKIISLIETKTLSRQYHTFFDWDSQNTNKFFGYFGIREETRKLLKEKNLLDAEKAFLMIGRERNKLVHNNYVEAIIDYTFDDIYGQYTLACTYIEFVREIFSIKKKA